MENPEPKPAKPASSADRCRSNGWIVGARLFNDMGSAPTTIEITSIGEESILAKVIACNGFAPSWAWQEVLWNLGDRDWVELPAASLAAATPPE